MILMSYYRYNSPDDPYVLKGQLFHSRYFHHSSDYQAGSCAVEYRLALTDEGYEKYGTKYRRNAQSRSSSDDGLSYHLPELEYWSLTSLQKGLTGGPPSSPSSFGAW